MQVLSVWPPKGGAFCAVRHFEVELSSSSSCFSKTRRKRWELVDVLAPSCCLFVVSSGLVNGRNEGYCRRSRFCIRSGVCSKFVLFCEPNKSYLGSSVSMVMALQKEETGSEFHRVGNGSDSGIVDEGSDDHEDEVDCKTGEQVRGVSGERIDVRALAESLHSAKTADDVGQVLKHKAELPAPVYSSMIRGLGWDKKMESALALVEWLKRKKKETGGVVGPNLFIYNSLLGAVKQSEQYEQTEKIVTDMIEDGILPNVVTYNTLMVISVNQGQPTKALEIFEEMQSKGFTPSSASYSTVLLAYRRMEDGNGALRFFVEIREKYLKGDLGKETDDDWEKEYAKLENFIFRICYQVMRRWLVRHENMSTNVLRLLTDMDRAGLQISWADYEKLMWACTREEHYVVAKELYNRIREGHSEISLSVCNHLIWVMGKAKKWWAALEIYEDLLDRGPKPNNMSYELIVSHFNILLTAARRRGIWRWGVRLLNKMEDKGIKPGSKQWNAVLVACSKASETSAAIQIFRRMVEQGEKPTVVSYGALLSALEKGKLYDEAVRVWDHMLKVGVEPNLYAYTIMASVFTDQGKFKLVDATLKDMVASGIEPTVVTYNAIISGCARNNMSSAAYEWFHRMKVQNITPNEITYEMLIEGLAADGKPRIAYELYLRAQHEGLDLSAKAFDAVAHSSQVYGATIDVSVLGPRPPDKKKKLQIRKDLKEFCNLADVPRSSKPFDRKELYFSHIEDKT